MGSVRMVSRNDAKCNDQRNAATRAFAKEEEPRCCPTMRFRYTEPLLEQSR